MSTQVAYQNPEIAHNESSASAPLSSGNQLDERARLLFAVWVPLAREVLKLVVIAMYLVFAVWLVLVHGNLIGFVPLLPWAFRLRAPGRS